MPRPWYWWLVIMLYGTTAWSLLPVLAPDASRRLMSILVFGRAGAYELSAPAIRYITFINGVVGAVMVGWSVALLFVIVGPFRRGECWAWRAIATSLLAWFVPGTLFSIWSGVMLNVAVNCLFFIACAIPLIATYRRFHKGKV